MNPTDLAFAALAIALGGFLKGATGAGAPVVGVPVLAILFGVQQAVAVFAVVNLVSNIWQGFAYRAAIPDMRFALRFAALGAAGAFCGTFLLAWLPTDVLMGGLALIVFLYIGLRLARPGWRLAREQGARLVVPVGFSGGLMQGAGGISAPISVTYLNAMRLERSEFVATISIFFLAMSCVQIPAMIGLGLLTWERTWLALAGLVPLFAAMPLGDWAARRVSKETFDRLVLALLAVVALRLVYAALT